MNINPGVALPEASPIGNEDLDLLLSDLSVDDAQDLEPVEEIEEIEEVAAAPVFHDDDIRDLELEVAKADSYEEQEAGAGDVTVEAITEEPAAKPTKTTRAKKAASPKVSVNRDLSTLAAAAFVLSETDVPADLEANKTTVLALRPTQKKIAEKFDNVISSLAASKLPSTYVVDAYKVLKAKSSVTSSELVAAFMADDYNEGTARSQTGQIMNLFAALKIANRSGSSLVLNADSALGARLNNLLIA